MTPDSGIISIFLDKFLIGILIFVRVSGMIASAPFFRSQTIIPHVKIILAFLLTAWIATAFSAEQPAIDFHPWSLLFIVLKEFFVGLAIGFVANTVFFAARFAGGLIDFDMGYQTATLFTQDSTTPTLIGELKEMVAIMLFLIIGGHHYLIESMFASLQAIPITIFAVTDSTIELLIKMASAVMILGIKISSPILVALFLTNLALALLARVAPQTNIFILSFQLKVFVGLIVLVGSVPLFVYVTKGALGTFQEELYRMLLTLNPSRVP